MARKLDDIMAALPEARRQRVQARAMELTALKDPRQAAQQTQEQLATTPGVRQLAGANRGQSGLALRPHRS